MASQSSSERSRFWFTARVRFTALMALLVVVGTSGCVTVRPEEREFLADSSMNFGSGGEADAHGSHILSNREGSFGAGEFSGGGCGCN